MNTWGYLILIAALLLLAGVMLYARFASRSREKSLHHQAPVEWVFSSDAISAAPLVATDLPATGEISSREESVVSDVESAQGPHVRLENPVTVSIASVVEKEAPKDRDRDYIDELQEAAAGLAKLMRSSPVSRVDPVVFAPRPESEVKAEPVHELLVPEEPLVEVFIDQAVEAAPIHHEPVLALEQVESVDTVEDGLVIDAEAFSGELPEVEDSISEVLAVEVPVKVLSFRELVGDAVADQFDRIDEGLDALESLVDGIGDSLRALADLEAGEFVAGTVHEGESGAEVAAAA